MRLAISLLNHSDTLPFFLGCRRRPIHNVDSYWYLRSHWRFVWTSSSCDVFFTCARFFGFGSSILIFHFHFTITSIQWISYMPFYRLLRFPWRRRVSCACILVLMSRNCQAAAGAALVGSTMVPWNPSCFRELVSSLCCALFWHCSF